MTDNNNAVNTQNTWEQKGLGWLPDHPDLRDYQLDKEEIQKGGRLNIEEETSNLEGLADSVIKALKLMQKTNRDSEANQNEFESLIQNLQNKVFGNVSFLNVRLRKILRPAPKSINLSSFSLSFPCYKDELSKQTLHELKTYLYLLLSRENSKYNVMNNFTFSEGIIDHEEIREIQTNIVKAISWLKDPVFDKVTTLLLRDVMRDKKDDVKNRDVVGPFTYNILSKMLHSNLHSRSIRHEVLKSFPSVQLVSVSSLVPSEIIQLLFESLIKICAKQLKESSQIIVEEDIFKQEFLKERRAEYFGAYLKENLKDFSEVHKFLSSNFPFECTEEDKITEWLLENRYFWFTLVSKSDKKKFISVEAKNKLFVEMSCKVFNNEFKVIEPLVSVLLKLIMPLASGRYHNWSEAIADGLCRFEELITAKSDPSNLPNETDNDRFLRFLSVEAIQKTCLEIKEGLELVTDEIKRLYEDQSTLNNELSSSRKLNQDDKEHKQLLDSVKVRCQEKETILGATLYFYFLIEQFVEHYKRPDYKVNLKSHNIDFPNQPSPNQANLFDKREALEIENPACFYRGDFSPDEQEEIDEHKVPEVFPLFPTETLQIPVLINLSRLLGLNYLDAQTSAYFLLPSVVDLSFWCTPVRDQGALRSCTAMAGVALMEYFVNRSQNKYTDLSPLFLYKVARKQLNLTDDVGASLRETIKAMALHGVPPESVWKYNVANVNVEPPPFCYSYAQNYRALKYFRLDYAGISSEALLFQIKAVLAAGFPCMFGFTIYSSAYDDANAKQGWIPFPDAQRDKVTGGHAVVVVGYDDYRLIPRADRTNYTLGAFLIRNCWGQGWGRGGYGWLPYDYVRQELTYDWWSLLKTEWFEADLLGAGANNLEGPKWPLQASLDGDFYIGGPGQG